MRQRLAPQLRCIDRLAQQTHNRATGKFSKESARGSAPRGTWDFPMSQSTSRLRSARARPARRVRCGGARPVGRRCRRARLGRLVAVVAARAAPGAARAGLPAAVGPDAAGPDAAGPAPRASRRRGNTRKARRQGQGQPRPAGLRPAQQHLPAARAAAGGGDAGRQPGPRAAAQDRERHAPARAQLPGGAAAAQPRRLLGPVPVLQDAAAHAALHPARRRGGRAAGSGSPTSTAQRRQIMGTRDRSFQDDIIRELARNGCGQQYVTEMRRREARNPFSALWGEEDSEAPRGSANQFGNLPFATYRTLCVRLCDGYYFPVSFSTLPNHFQRDVGPVPVAVRGARRALLPPEPRRRRRADGLGRQPAALYQPQDRRGATARSSCRAARARRPNTSRRRAATRRPRRR